MRQTFPRKRGGIPLRVGTPAFVAGSQASVVGEILAGK
jgi:hypothetical protein